MYNAGFDEDHIFFSGVIEYKIRLVILKVMHYFVIYNY